MKVTAVIVAVAFDYVLSESCSYDDDDDDDT